MSPTKHRREAEKMKMAGFTYFPFDVVDWMTSADVMAMTAAERGVYITLLCVQYRDGFVPSEPQMCAKASGFRVEMVRRWFAKWSHLFPISDSDQSHLRNEKLHEIAVSVGKLAPREGAKENKTEQTLLKQNKSEDKETTTTGVVVVLAPQDEKVRLLAEEETEDPEELVAGYTQAQIEAQVNSLKGNGWVEANDSSAARLREGYVKHLFSIDPLKAKKDSRPAYKTQGKQWL